MPVKGCCKDERQLAPLGAAAVSKQGKGGHGQIAENIVSAWIAEKAKLDFHLGVTAVRKHDGADHWIAENPVSSNTPEKAQASK